MSDKIIRIIDHMNSSVFNGITITCFILSIIVALFIIIVQTITTIITIKIKPKHIKKR